MKNPKVVGICTAGLAASVIIFMLTGRTLIKDGYARDAGIYVSSTVSTSLWLLCVFCLIAFIGFCLLSKFLPPHSEAVAGVLLALLIASGIAVNTMWRISFDSANSAEISHDNIESISLAELKDVLQSDEDSVIYFGRRSCPLCEQILPDLLDYLAAENIIAKYYNTSLDRDSNVEQMQEILATIPVNEVPLIVVTKDGTVAETFAGENLVEQFKEYRAKQQLF